MSKMIQVRNVSDEAHRVLKTRAPSAGMSLSDYIARSVVTERAVVDASVIVALLMEPERLIADHIEVAATAWAPHLLDAEVGHVLRRRVRAGIDTVSFYDGLYVALAERLEVPLLTLDEASPPRPGRAASSRWRRRGDAAPHRHGDGRPASGGARRRPRRLPGRGGARGQRE